MSAPEMPSETGRFGLQQSLLSQFRRHFRCSHADHCQPTIRGFRLRYLHDLPIDELKLDRQFIAPVLVDWRATAIVRAVIDLAHALGLTTVAEGVENAAIAARLRDYGCDVAQGYYYSPPLAAPDMLELLKSATRAPVAARSN